MEKKVEDMNIYEKMLGIMSVMGIEERNAKGYSYKYVTEDVLQAKLTGAMQRFHVILRHSVIPGSERVEETIVTSTNKQGVVTNRTEYRYTAATKYTWVNVDNPSDFIEDTYTAVGQMTDPAQAFGAAETYCNRYYIMKTFQMPTPNDDPDYIRSLEAMQADAAGEDTPKATPSAKTPYGKATAGRASTPVSRVVSPTDPISKEEITNMFATATIKFGKDYGIALIRSYTTERGIESSSLLTKTQYAEILKLINDTPVPMEVKEELPFPETH